MRCSERLRVSESSDTSGVERYLVSRYLCSSVINCEVEKGTLGFPLNLRVQLLRRLAPENSKKTMN